MWQPVKASPRDGLHAKLAAELGVVVQDLQFVVEAVHGQKGRRRVVALLFASSIPAILLQKR